MAIIIGHRLDKHTFVSGDTYHFIDYAIKNGEEFRKGINVIFNDPDDGEEFIGEIEWLIILEDNTIQASIKDISYGRVNLDILELY